MSTMQSIAGGLAQALAVPHHESLTDLGLRDCDSCDSGKLLDAVMLKMRLANDEELAHQLRGAEQIISMIRRRQLSISRTSMLMWMHKETGITMQELTDMMAQDNRRTGL